MRQRIKCTMKTMEEREREERGEKRQVFLNR
jgi:hypothetical protein